MCPGSRTLEGAASCVPCKTCCGWQWSHLERGSLLFGVSVACVSVACTFPQHHQPAAHNKPLKQWCFNQFLANTLVSFAFLKKHMVLHRAKLCASKQLQARLQKRRDFNKKCWFHRGRGQILRQGRFEVPTRHRSHFASRFVADTWCRRPQRRRWARTLWRHTHKLCSRFGSCGKD